MFRLIKTHKLVSTLAAALVTSVTAAAVATANIEPAATKAYLVSTNPKLVIVGGETIDCQYAIAFHAVAGGSLKWALGKPGFGSAGGGHCKTSGGKEAEIVISTGWMLKQKAMGSLTADVELPAKAAVVKVIGTTCEIVIGPVAQTATGGTWANGTNSETLPSSVALSVTVAIEGKGACAGLTTAEFDGFFVALDSAALAQAIKFT
jgi:hypothetical protein